MTVGQNSHYLVLTDFKFAVPTNATILGIKVDVERISEGSCTMVDNAVRVVKGGTIQSTDRSNGTSWPFTDTYVSYGSESDLWGTTFTPSDINSSGFGFAISGKCTLVPGGGGGIDHVRITVYYDMRDIRLSWGSGSDTETSTRLLQYQLKLGTGSNANNIVSGVTASPNWVNRLMPNGQSKTYLLKNLLCRTGLTYYWSVSAVDTGFKKTASAEQTFTLDSACTFTPGGGGSSGGTSGGSSGGSTGGSTGGGIAARFFDRSGGNAAASTKVGTEPVNPIITVSVFNDLSGDGIKNSREDSRFKGLALTASGRTADGIIANKTLLMSDSGQVRFGLPPRTVGATGSQQTLVPSLSKATTRRPVPSPVRTL
jgi:hypothetical protein